MSLVAWNVLLLDLVSGPSHPVLSKLALIAHTEVVVDGDVLRFSIHRLAERACSPKQILEPVVVDPHGGNAYSHLLEARFCRATGSL